jgi:hypothetical protein
MTVTGDHCSGHFWDDHDRHHFTIIAVKVAGGGLLAALLLGLFIIPVLTLTPELFLLTVWNPADPIVSVSTPAQIHQTS